MSSAWTDSDRVDRILRSITADYCDSGSGELLAASNGALEAVRAVMDNVAESDGGQSCLVCIEDMGSKQAIWSCPACYVCLHLACIQRWIRSLTVSSDSATENWTCPNCRAEFQPIDVPRRYTCYCGKAQDPEFDPWLVPHSCGSRCDRLLTCGGSGHTCLLLCHPGRCPPCPRTESVVCHCGNGGIRQMRCSQTWSCEKPCHHRLPDCQHRCPVTCHPGQCQPCSVQLSNVPCRCGSEQLKQVLCSKRDWQCENICGRSLSCGHHACQKVCHSGDCGSCPLSGARTCPCGKLPLPGLTCTDTAVTTCSDTCAKSLACGRHQCPDQCHLGPCPPCREMVRKACRCGKTVRETQCHKQITCEVKCGRDRGCGRHQCKRRCCPGGCPPCDAVCGRPLNCGQHKCQSPCHSGPCYPCTERKVIACPCGFARIAHACGSRGSAPRPPRCPRPCLAGPDCQHPARAPHTCHPGDCPPCRLVCGASLPCSHPCQSPCHTARMVTIRREVRGPWDGPQEVQEVRCLPCPPCRTLVPINCLGGHELTEAPCCEAKPRPCGRKCAAELDCGRHRCELDCHKLIPEDPRHHCEQPCQQRRQQQQRRQLNAKFDNAASDIACRHPCPLTCHPGACPPCKLSASVRCHCGASKLRRTCRELTAADDDKLADLLRCPNACQRRRPGCGHPCGAPCHPGLCADFSEKCEAPVEQRCPCRRIQRLVPCHRLGAVPANGDDASTSSSIACDSRCQQEVEARRRRQAASSPADSAAAAAAAAATRQAEASLLRRIQQQQQRRRHHRDGEDDDDSGDSKAGFVSLASWPILAVFGLLRRQWKLFFSAFVVLLLAGTLAWAALSETA